METEAGDFGTREMNRQQKIAERDRMTPDIRHESSLTIAEKLTGFIEARNFKFIHCYISFRSEVETRDFIEAEIKSGTRVVVPIVEELDGKQFLIHSEISGLTNLKKGTFGLDEPVERTPSSLESLDAVIVPITAFDRRGTRLGYGKGFYDKFLRELPKSVVRIGLAFSGQEVESIPKFPHDESLDIIVTEREIINC
jgi:5-formyltetrahydrofolate cyclo-ligase